MGLALGDNMAFDPVRFEKGVVRANSKTGGFDATLKMFKRLQDQAGALGASIVNRQLEIIFKQSQIYVPVDTGVLSASGRIVYATASEPRGRIEYPVFYAVYVHERFANHAPPTTWKYLEFAVRDTYKDLYQAGLDKFGELAKAGYFSVTYQGSGPFEIPGEESGGE
jgi:hypothetical protein